MKRPTTLLERILQDAGLQLKLAVDRDCETIRSRFKHEGMSFLTITLPSLDDALIQGLSRGRISPALYPGFKPWKRGGSLPAFMARFFMRVFDKDGWLLETPCVASIDAIRQVTRTFKKVRLNCTKERQRRAYERYVSNDQNVLDPGLLPALCDSNFRAVAGYLWSDLQIVSRALYCSGGRFGTGATAERYTANQRYSIREWPERGEHRFPLSYHCSSREDDVDTFNSVALLGEDAEQPVRVVQVPKTLKTPRTISVEPSYMMLRQQSVAKPLMDILEKGYLGFKSIRFSDQSVNRDLARSGSIDGSLATIDLSDASDLVSMDLVREVFRSCPEFLAYLEDSRSKRARLPDGSVMSLRKFASMGSALCFPVEAMVFFTIVIATMVKATGRRPSRRLIAATSANVAVYGDDIIVPSETATAVMDNLVAFGLRVNHEKSFSTGLFRESCGGDYYAGELVLPAYLREFDLGGNTRDARVIASYVSFSNQLYVKGYWNAAQYVRSHVEQLVGPLPHSRSEIGCLTFHSYLYDTMLRYDPASSGYRVKGLRLVARKVHDPILDVRGAMLRSFEAQHLGRSRERVADDFVRYREDHQAHHDTLFPGRAGDGLVHGVRPVRPERNEPDALATRSYSGRHVLGRTGFLHELLSSERYHGPMVSRSDSEGTLLYLADEDRKRAMAWLDSVQFTSSSGLTDQSVRPYALKLKRRWSRANAHLHW